MTTPHRASIHRRLRLSASHRIRALVLPIALLTTCFTHQPITRADGPPLTAAKADIAIQLDQPAFRGDQRISGKLIFQIHQVRDEIGAPVDVVVLNGPVVRIVLSDNLAAALPQVTFSSPLSKTIKIGHRYELPFSIRMDEAFASHLQKKNRDYLLFQEGEHTLSALVNSAVRSPGENPPPSPFRELNAKFESKPVEVKILRPIEEHRISRSHLLETIAALPAELKGRAVTFYARRGVLTEADLLGQIKQAEGRLKADLSAYWLNAGLPVDKLDFFTTPGASHTFTGHEGKPVYFLLRPQQRTRLTFDVRKIHHFRGLGQESVVHSTTTLDVVGPRTGGVYEMMDDRHKQPWGWVLVQEDREAIAGAATRPNTSELSAKVAEALYKRDAAALKALAAPDFNADATIRDLRFKLGFGDVRYLTSTGTQNKVKTRLQINLAPPDKEPVFARELWLQFERIGDELKLTHAQVWDAEK